MQLEADGLVTRTFCRLDPKRQNIVLNAILEEAQARGLAAVNIKIVAERAGMSVASLYQYFGSRERMIDATLALTEHYMAQLFASSRAHLLDLSLAEALYAYVYYGCDWMNQERALLRLFARAAYQGDPDLQERLVRPTADAMLALMRDLGLAAQARGELPATLDPHAAARFLHATTTLFGDTALLLHLDTFFRLQGEHLETSLRRWIAFLLGGVQGAVGTEDRPKRRRKDRP